MNPRYPITTTILTLAATLTTAAQTHNTTQENNAANNIERTYTLREKWFVEAGLDMTLTNPYDHPFSQTFKKGRSFGLDAALGKEFSPEIALRARLKWENGCPILKNHHLEWLAPAGPNGINMDKGGCLFAHIDVILSLRNIIGHYDPHSPWDIIIFPRAGLGSNLAINSLSPMVGLGCGYTHRLTPHLTLYADAAYQGITSEFFDDVACTGMGVSTGFNGILDFHLGVRIDLHRRSK